MKSKARKLPIRHIPFVTCVYDASPVTRDFLLSPAGQKYMRAVIDKHSPAGLHDQLVKDILTPDQQIKSPLGKLKQSKIVLFEYVPDVGTKKD